MPYRILPHGGEKISVIGLGSSAIQASSEREIEKTIRFAVENGVNYFDMASAEAKPFPACGRALAVPCGPDGKNGRIRRIFWETGGHGKSKKGAW